VQLLGGIDSCSESDFAYSYTLLHSVVCLSDCLFSVCHIFAPSLNRYLDLDYI